MRGSYRLGRRISTRLEPTTRTTKPIIAHTPRPMPSSGLRPAAAVFDEVLTDRVTLPSKRLLDCLRRIAAAFAIVLEKLGTRVGGRAAGSGRQWLRTLGKVTMWRCAKDAVDYV